MSSRPKPVKGMVLIAVLWVVAALSLMLSALTHTVRGEIRQVSYVQARAQASALGDAAIYIVLQRITSAPEDRPKQSTVLVVPFDGVSIGVRVTPANGLIDINNAPPDLFRQMLMFSGKGDAQAQEIAAQIVAYRSRKDFSGRPLGFGASEDLLRVPGFDFDLYAKVAPLVTAEIPTGGSGKVNPMAAPLPVLELLAGGNKAAASSIFRARESGTPGIDMSALDPQHVAEMASTAVYSVRAEVPNGAGSSYFFERAVILGNPGPKGIPWQTIRMGLWSGSAD